MVNNEHLEILHSGRKSWNLWRRRNRNIVPDLRDARLRELNLRGYDLSDALLRKADLSGSDLAGADGKFAIFSRADLSHANLRKADLRGASFRRANLTRANFTQAILRHASLVEANVQDARFSGANIYGAGIWGAKGEPEDQSKLLIDYSETLPPITTDDLDTAQFLFLLLENPKIADVIESASNRSVLILGRFTPPRKAVLLAIKEHLLSRNFVPILFDFDKPEGRDLTETVACLAHMACFIIADLTEAKSIPQELSHIIPYLPSVPLIPIIQEQDDSYAMFEHFTRYPWVKPMIRYHDIDHLKTIFDNRILRLGFHEAMRSRGRPNTKLPKPIPNTIRHHPSGGK